MIRKFLLILVSLGVINSVVFGAEASSGSSIKSDSLYKENRLKNDEPTTFDKLDLKCRALTNSDFKTQIIDFDIEKGITYCQVYKKDNPDFIFSTNADAQWVLYRKSENNQLEKEKAVTQIQSMSSNIGKSTGNSSDGDTLSTFMVKTVLLMDNSGGSKGTNVTEYDATDFSAQMENSSGVVETTKAFFSWLGNTITSLPKYIGSKMGIDTEIATKELKVPYVATASDGFNTENFAYYRALFNGMNTVYIHLQNLLFIVVGGFFLATLGGGKIQKYLENRGQSIGNKEPYLRKFFIPLLCAGVFYMSITSSEFCIMIWKS